MRARNIISAAPFGSLFAALVSFMAVALVLSDPGPVSCQGTTPSTPTTQAEPSPSSGLKDSANRVSGQDEKAFADMSTEQRLRKIETTLQEIKRTGKAAEERTYYNKLLGNRMLALGKAAVVILLIIAVVFPLTLVFLGRRRILGPWNVSSDLPTTLVAVEERQAKLANILREIQSEIDYIHSMSVPDLKKLIEQAEKYIAQNEKDLEKAGITVRDAKHTGGEDKNGSS